MGYLKNRDGLFLITPDDAGRFMGKLTVEKFYGIGKVTAEKMHKLGIHNGFDLKKPDLLFLIRNFGKAGKFYFDIVGELMTGPLNQIQNESPWDLNWHKRKSSAHK